MGRFNGKTIIVVGGASGIGAATATRLGAEGANVVVGDINADNAELCAESIRASGGRAVSFSVDVSKEESVRDLVAYTVDTFSGLDGLHNNAADLSPEVFGRDSDAVDVDLAVWQRTLDVDLRGYLLGIRYAVPELLRRGGGAIVNTSSLAAFLGEPQRVSYGVAKAGILALTRHTASRWGKEGIRCNALAVGSVLTDANLRGLPDSDRVEMLAAARSPRLGAPDDIAAVATFLLSDDAEWINGQTYHADGGWVLR